MGLDVAFVICQAEDLSWVALALAGTGTTAVGASTELIKGIFGDSPSTEKA